MIRPERLVNEFGGLLAIDTADALNRFDARYRIDLVLDILVDSIGRTHDNHVLHIEVIDDGGPCIVRQPLVCCQHDRRVVEIARKGRCRQSVGEIVIVSRCENDGVLV